MKYLSIQDSDLIRQLEGCTCKNLFIQFTAFLIILTQKLIEQRFFLIKYAIYTEEFRQ